jgi:hypothetical protein
MPTRGRPWKPRAKSWGAKRLPSYRQVRGRTPPPMTPCAPREGGSTRLALERARPNVKAGLDDIAGGSNHDPSLRCIGGADRRRPVRDTGDPSGGRLAAEQKCGVSISGSPSLRLLRVPATAARRSLRDAGPCLMANRYSARALPALSQAFRSGYDRGTVPPSALPTKEQRRAEMIGPCGGWAGAPRRISPGSRVRLPQQRRRDIVPADPAGAGAPIAQLSESRDLVAQERAFSTLNLKGACR